MSVKALQFNYGGNSRTAPDLQNVNITVRLNNGKFVTQASPYTLNVFYGVPPKYGNDYPVTSSSLYEDRVEFNQNINSLYAVANVETSSGSIAGTISTPTPLPYAVTITPIDGSETVSLPPGHLEIEFNIPISGLSPEQAEKVIARQLDAIKKA